MAPTSAAHLGIGLAAFEASESIDDSIQSGDDDHNLQDTWTQDGPHQGPYPQSDTEPKEERFHGWICG